MEKPTHRFLSDRLHPPYNVRVNFSFHSLMSRKKINYQFLNKFTWYSIFYLAIYFQKVEIMLKTRNEVIFCSSLSLTILLQS